MRIDVVRPFKRPRPEPLPELDDWVGCVGAGAVGGLLAAGLYNGAVCLSRVPEGDGGAPAQGAAADGGAAGGMTRASAHAGPVKGVAHLAAGEGRHWLASASKDCTLRTWQLAPGASAPVCTAVCSGHTDAVDSVQACPVASQDTALFASASWDTTVKLWEAPLVVRAAREPTTVLPKASMDGHTQAVSCLCWRQSGTIYRCAQSLRAPSPPAMINQPVPEPDEGFNNSCFN